MQYLPWFACVLLLSTNIVHARVADESDALYQQLIELRKQYDRLPHGPQQATAKGLQPELIRASRERERIQKEMMEVALKLAESDPGTDRGLHAIEERMNFGHQGKRDYELLSERYASREHIGYLLNRFTSIPASKPEIDFMKSIIRNNKHVKDVAQARFRLVLTTRDADKKQAIKECERLVIDLKESNDSDLKTIAASAEGIVFDHKSLAVGKVVPELECKDTDGIPFKLSDYRGKVVLLHFWSHSQYGGGKWANTERDETDFTADKRALLQRMQGKPLVLLGINTDRDLNEVHKFNRERKVNWRSFWCGRQGSYEPLALHWNVRYGNQFLVIDHRGIIAGKNVGDIEHGVKFNQDVELNTMLNQLIQAVETENGKKQ
ncbi:MAG TPA: TlpA disulfide reductase family protein [Gemmatales bacterium]|nr:TlpA disulfide reductase family protein [Gemmatales bacterium]